VSLPAGWHITAHSSEITAGSGDDVWVRGMSTEVDEDAGAGRFRDAHYDGRRWRFLPDPPRGYEVDKIAVVGPDTWAALHSESPSGAYTVILARWDGHTWVRCSSPIRMGFDNVAMVADGQGGIWLLNEKFVGHWNRRHWNVAELPDTLPRTASVSDLAHVPGTTAIWGVGEYGTDGYGELPFIETTGSLSPSR
jgi:hypothetical protein